VAIVTDRGRGSKEQGNLVVKEAVAALMVHWGAPFKFKASSEGAITGVLEASGAEVAAWLLSDNFKAQLFPVFLCGGGGELPTGERAAPGAAAFSVVGSLLDDIDNTKEVG